jgi:hypothetical protein
MPFPGMLRRVGHARIDVSEENFSSIINVTTIGELGTNLILAHGLFSSLY